MAADNFKNVWVYIDKTGDGLIKNVSLELINGAKSLTKENGEKVVAVIIGSDNQTIIDTVKKYGADQILSVDGEAYKTFNLENYTGALAALVTEYAPAAVLFGATLNGKDLAAGLAAKSETSVANDCTAAAVVDGAIEWTRAIYGGKFLTKVVGNGVFPQIATVRTGIFSKVEAPSDAEVIKKSIEPKNPAQVKLVNVIKADNSSINLEEAKVVVGAGRGVNDKNMADLKELASLFEAGGVGGTRPVIDAGLLSPQEQIGLSGKKISPDLYFAIGVSGASQHVQGIKDSKVIVAVNRDADAPIFEISDYGVVGDLNQVVPAVISEIKKLK
ncbi:electron transfer flavoprotein subunit alpha/FixB family protein [Sporolactobacillus sp. KGMB 08714]|uniref:electron transfer flavoprotein subunit alpha/FixB family protein n=1 Tax=Sporolactobacillus sp. KGMB 08714 TaxID=3064704 RepID=UPI002FBDCE91